MGEARTRAALPRLVFLFPPGGRGGGRAASKLKAQALADLEAQHLKDALARDGFDQEDAEEAELRKRGGEERETNVSRSKGVLASSNFAKCSAPISPTLL